jgi:hypothetical protein
LIEAERVGATSASGSMDVLAGAVSGLQNDGLEKENLVRELGGCA